MNLQHVLILLAEKNILKSEKTLEAKEILREVVSMIVGLIKSNSDRVYEEQSEYNIRDKKTS